MFASVAIWRLAPRVKVPEPKEKPPRIVVLPFENPVRRDAYFASGITEEITSRLAV